MDLFIRILVRLLNNFAKRTEYVAALHRSVIDARISISSFLLLVSITEQSRYPNFTTPLYFVFPTNGLLALKLLCKTSIKIKNVH